MTERSGIRTRDGRDHEMANPAAAPTSWWYSRMPMTRARPPIAILISILGLSLVSCNSGGVDFSELEERLVQEQEAKAPDLEVGEASCPEDVEVKDGAAFECTVEVEGKDAPYAVTMSDVDEDGENAHFDIEPAKPIIDVSKVIEFLRSQLNPASAGAEVDCGQEKVIISEVDGTIDCTVSDGEFTEEVSVVVKDVQGTVSLEN